MTSQKSKIFPIILTAIIIFIIVYLFINIKQPLITCSKTTNSLNIEIREELQVKLDGRKIKEMEVTKTIILPPEYLSAKENYLNTIKYAIKDSYEYLGQKKVSYKNIDNGLIVTVKVHNNETIILNNIDFTNKDSLQIKINSNTKSSDVVTLKVNDNYTEGELMTHLKNNEYHCK